MLGEIKFITGKEANSPPYHKGICWGCLEELEKQPKVIAFISIQRGKLNKRGEPRVTLRRVHCLKCGYRHLMELKTRIKKTKERMEITVPLVDKFLKENEGLFVMEEL